MKKLFLMLGLMGLILAPIQANAALSTVDVSPGVDDVREINNATPGTSKTFLGTRLRGPLQIGSTTSAACSTSNGGCNTISTTEATAVTLKTSSAFMGNSISLENGYSNQIKTYVLVTDGGKDFYVTPVTKSGFTSVQLDDAKDSVTLKYIDSTVGWVISGNNGATIN